MSGSVFAEWNWDGHQLTLRNDRYGMLPVFSVVEPSRVILSTTIEGALAAGAPADLDARAIAVILRLGYPVGDDTPF
ncbi:MAG: asparagine synthetase B family protein, partial [Gemmatimonadota bacterium]